MNKLFKLVLTGALTTALALGGTGTGALADGVILPDYSSVTVSKAFGDGMVIQRNSEFLIWGYADGHLDGEPVFVNFMGKEEKGVISGGEWNVMFPAFKETTEGSDMVVTCGTKKITVKDILFGDVYMAVGQSNIAYTFNEAITNSPEGYAGNDTVPSENDLIRICNNGLVYQDAYPAQGSDEECKDIIKNGGWQKTTADTVRDFSAVGYFFAKDILKKTEGKVPIGIIEINGNGQAINAFLPNEVADRLEVDEKDADGLYKTNYGGTKIPTRFMYNHYMRPFKNTALAGMIWYQGESDFIVGSYETYNERFTALVDYMRENNGSSSPNFPVFIVELPSMFNGSEEGWAFLPTAAVRSRMGLIPTLVNNSYIASTSDIWKDKEHKNNLHPYCKYDIAKRLSDLAGSVIYKERALNFVAGPQFKGYTLSDDGKSVRVYFDYAAKGLKAFSDGQFKGFTVNDNRTPVKVEAVAYNCIEISSDEVITQVKYNAPPANYDPAVWNAVTANTFPENINACNSEGMPMVAFSAPVTRNGQMTVYETGDADINGKVNAEDALATLQNVVGLNEFSNDEFTLADANLDGLISSVDALLILQRTVGIVTLPAVKE